METGTGLPAVPAAGRDSNMTSPRRTMEISTELRSAAAAGKCQRYFSPLLKVEAQKFTGGSRRKMLEGTVSSAAEQSQAQITHYSHV